MKTSFEESFGRFN